MTFEIGGGKGFGSTRWSSTSIAPFGPAPGANALGEGMSRHPRQKATTDFESGFAAEPVESEFVAPGETVLGRWPVKVMQRSVTQGQIPAALVQVYLTDRGTLTQPQLDQGLLQAVRGAGYRISKAVKLEPVSVTWVWRHEPDFYYPVVSTPSNLAGMKYAGNAITLPAYSAAPAELAKLPRQMYVYTFAATTAQSTMTDADAAKLLSTLKAAMASTLPAAQAYANVYFTRLGAPEDAFGPAGGSVPAVAKLGFSALALIAAVNIFSQQVKVR